MPRKSYVKKSRKRTYRKGKNLMSMVKRMLPQREKKLNEINMTSQAHDYNGSIDLLSGIAVGTTPLTRVGRRINVKSMLFRYGILASGASTGYLHRVIVFVDTQGTGTIPTVGGILQNIASANAPNSALEYTQAGRYKILYDKLHRTDAASGLSIDHKCYKKLNLKLDFNADTAAQADTFRNAMYVIFLSDVVTTNVPVHSYSFRIRFEDD